MIKRLFDIVVSGAGLLLFAPVAAVIAAAIRIEDGGPVLFVQERVGKDCRVFPAFKFRSMIVDAERHTGAVQATVNDPRDGLRRAAAAVEYSSRRYEHRRPAAAASRRSRHHRPGSDAAAQRDSRLRSAAPCEARPDRYRTSSCTS